jgi:hypothetical protein
MRLAVFWEVKPSVTLKAERELVSEMLSAFPQGALEVESILLLGPGEGLAIVDADEAAEMWKALQLFEDRVELKIKPTYITSLDDFLRRRQEVLAQAEEWLERHRDG